VRGVNCQGENGAHHSHAFFVGFARSDGFFRVRQVHHHDNRPGANLSETSLLVLSQIHLRENQTKNQAHHHDTTPIKLRVLDGGSLPFHVRDSRHVVSHGHLEKERNAAESHAKEAFGRGRRWFVPHRAGRKA